MKSLPEVTLVAIDGSDDPSATVEAFNAAKSQMKFGRLALFANVGKANFFIPKIDRDGYNRFCIRQLWKYVETSHTLTIQHDSRIANPAEWDDSWLGYDYIGAPWPVNHGGQPHRVGNSGFCLRSQRLLYATSKVVKDDHTFWNGKHMSLCLDDVVTCVTYRNTLTGMGMKFAPLEVAAKFAFEQPTIESKKLDRQFGYHEFHP